MLFHTFPLCTFFAARIPGAGMGGSDMASSIPAPGMGDWSREYPVFCNGVFLPNFTGVSRELGVITSAVRTTPRRVRFLAHVTRWNVGEVECSRARFLDMAARDGGAQEGSLQWTAESGLLPQVAVYVLGVMAEG